MSTLHEVRTHGEWNLSLLFFCHLRFSFRIGWKVTLSQGIATSGSCTPFLSNHHKRSITPHSWSCMVSCMHFIPNIEVKYNRINGVQESSSINITINITIIVIPTLVVILLN